MDLEDLLEDIPTKGYSKPAKKDPPKKKPVDDGWGDLDLEDEPKSTGAFGLESDRNNKMQKQTSASFGFGGSNGLKKEQVKKEEEDEWALDANPTSSGGFGGRLLGRKNAPKKDDDDDLDNFLDDLEEKRGIESTSNKGNPSSS